MHIEQYMYMCLYMHIEHNIMYMDDTIVQEIFCMHVVNHILSMTLIPGPRLCVSCTLEDGIRQLKTRLALG